MYGYANALSFKNISSNDILIVERYIREKTLLTISTNLSDAIGSKDVLIDDEEMRSYFGDLYASRPMDFKFEPGDLSYIGRLVDYVRKIADDGGENKGLHKFERKKKNIYGKKRTDTKKNYSKNLKRSDDDSIKSTLLKCVIDCLKQREPGKENFNSDLNSLDKSLVEVFTENDIPLYGNISCILCAQTNKPKKYRVYFYNGNKGKYWVLSNYAKHLKNSHGMKLPL